MLSWKSVGFGVEQPRLHALLAVSLGRVLLLEGAISSSLSEHLVFSVVAEFTVMMCTKVLTHGRCSVTGLSFHVPVSYIVVNLRLRARFTVSGSDVPCVAGLGKSDVIKVHFLLNKETPFRKIRKEAGIHQLGSGSGLPWDGTLEGFGDSGVPFVAGFGILEGLVTMLGFLKIAPPFDFQAVALVWG